MASFSGAGQVGGRPSGRLYNCHLNVRVTPATLCSMKAIVLGLLVAFGAVTGVQAQQALKVQLFADRQHFLAQEALEVSVRVYNYSGETLLMGKDPEWVSFTVEPMANKSIVRQASRPDVVYPFELGNNMMATRRVNLTPHFEIVHSGRYKITATVKFAQWGERSSEPLLVDVVNGSALWEREFGVPTSTDAAPEIRKYQILQTRHTDVSQLYVKVTDSYGSKVFGLRHIGQMVIAYKPDQQIDRNNRLHVLHRSGRASYTYSMVDYDGRVILRQRYEQESEPPRLRHTEAGEILVNGGVRTKAPSDIDPLADEMELKKQTQTP